MVSPLVGPTSPLLGRTFLEGRCDGQAEEKPTQEGRQGPHTYDRETFGLDDRVDPDVTFGNITMNTDSPEPLLLTEGVSRQLENPDVVTGSSHPRSYGKVGGDIQEIELATSGDPKSIPNATGPFGPCDGHWGDNQPAEDQQRRPMNITSLPEELDSHLSTVVAKHTSTVLTMQPHHKETPRWEQAGLDRTLERNVTRTQTGPREVPDQSTTRDGATQTDDLPGVNRPHSTDARPLVETAVVPMVRVWLLQSVKVPVNHN